MHIVDVPLSQIEIGERRRQDYGDIAGLAQGIKRVGLLEPIIVERNGQEDRYRLVAGERRLRAAWQLGWETIPAQLREQLSEADLRDIELEENENRKPLTEPERTRTFVSAKKVVESAKKAAEAISTETVEKDSRGRKAIHGAPKKDIAEALGIGTTTLVEAEQHVDIAERFPFLQSLSWKQYDVLRFRQHLQQLDPEEQAEFCAFVVRKYAPMEPPPHSAIQTAEVMTMKTPQARAEIYRLSESSDKRNRALAATRSVHQPPMPDQRLSFLDAALTGLDKALKTPYDREPEAEGLRGIRASIRAIQTSIRQRYGQLKKEEEHHVEADVRRAQQ
jgi:ParB/RepB/Spo0J family partition protein